MTTEPIRLIERARRDLRTRFTAVMQWVCDEGMLRASFERQSGHKAPGVDGTACMPLPTASSPLGAGRCNTPSPVLRGAACVSARPFA